MFHHLGQLVSSHVQWDITHATLEPPPAVHVLPDHTMVLPEKHNVYLAMLVHFLRVELLRAQTVLQEPIKQHQVNRHVSQHQQDITIHPQEA